MSDCKLTMQPQDDVVRELEVVFSDGTHRILSNETRPANPGELPKSWDLFGIEEVYWAKGDPAIWTGYGNYADHYIVRDCKIYDAKTGLPGYSAETPYWRASFKLESITPSTTSTINTSSTTSTTGSTTTTTTTSDYPTTVESQPELITNVGTTPLPIVPATELPFTGVAFAGFLFTLALLCVGLGFIVKAYYMNWIEKLDKDVKERAKRNHPSRSLHDDKSTEA